MTTKRSAAGIELCLGIGMGFVALVIATSGATGRRAAAGEPAPGSPQSHAVPAEPSRVENDSFDRDSTFHSAKETASYTINARLDEERHRIDGWGTIHWTNTTAEPAKELWIHLYLNAFKNSETLFFRSPFTRARSGRRPRTWGYIEVNHLVARELGDVDLWPDRAPHSPGDPRDETDIRVPLPTEVPPGAILTLDMRWAAQLPEIVERTGYSRGFHMVAQWFPKLARRQPDGTWAHFPFHPHSEFYADFGTYDVSIDVPSEMKVGATGEQVEKSVADGRLQVRHRAEGVHDFAWTAWEGFDERAVSIDGITLHLLHPAGHAKNADATVAAVRHGLDFFGRAYGSYPYPTLTVVHPPEHARAAGGMEYPTLITTGGAWYTSYVTNFIERVTLHELAHQWFYGLIATNEVDWPFLDEGLTTYAESRAMRALFGRGSGVDLPGIAIDGDAYLRATAADAAHRDVVAKPAASFANFRDLGALVYGRTAVVLQTLGRVYGQEALEHALGLYARRYRFRHPTPQDFVQVVREVMGEAAADTLDHALFEGGWVDFTARDLRTERAEPPAGIFDGGEAADAPEDSPDWIGRVIVYRHGTLTLPVDIELVTENGTRLRRRWDGRGPWTEIEYRGDAPLARAVVDPELKVPLDQNLLNNAVSTQPGGAPRLLERGLYAVELLLSWLGP